MQTLDALQRSVPARHIRPHRARRLRTDGLTPPKTHWARPIDTPPFSGYPLRPGITFTYLGLEDRRDRARCTSAAGQRATCSSPAR